ncbi:hypothetical protein GGQ19_001759 [Salinibacter ruber]|uniref:hypothetical protein n=1 Tax=Salinibacter ruber TaxID=146919 RepID=UPI002167E459|nr:hypothetical protein [Salinibacter ruber]MCS3750590.1 hypothetical protein [Salinibacter ruber]
MPEVREFDSELLEQTRKEWNKQVTSAKEEDDIVLAGDYDVILGWVESVLKDDSGKYKYARPCGVFWGDGYARSVLKLTHAEPHSDEPWLKLLQVYLEPRVDIDQRTSLTQGALKKAERVLSVSITKAIELTHDDIPAEILKIYGRTEKMRGLLNGIVASLPEDENLPGIEEVSMHGNWLVIDPESY